MRISAALLLCTGLILCQCSSTPNMAGGAGGETTNGITAVVVHADSTPAAYAIVRLRPAGYLTTPPKAMAKASATIIDSKTDHAGRFFMDSIESGSYTIEVTDAQATAVLLRCEAPPPDDTLDLGTRIMKNFASITGGVATDTASVQMVAQIYGLERRVPVDPIAGTYSFNDLPEGEYTVRLSPSSPDIGAAIVDAGLVDAGTSDTLPAVMLAYFSDEDYSQWASSAVIRINTTPSGADVADTVHDFPLLLRLDDSNIDFTGAHTEGRDVRFSKSNGTGLRYEIESWNANAGTAVIWVLVDTIFGNNSAQSISMHWGKADAPDFSNASVVFDTSRGFAGVWHCGSALTDATHNNNNGTNRGSSADSGVAGEGRRFDGDDDMVDCGSGPSLRITDSLTISAWVRLDQHTDDHYYRIVSKKSTWDAPAGFELECNPNVIDPTGKQYGVLTLMGPNLSFNRAEVTWDDEWHHCAATVAGTDIRIFFDGIDGTTWRWINSPLQADDAPLLIGGIGNDDYLDGTVDEVRLSRIARSPAWIRLEYENMREDQSLVILEK